MKYSTILFDLDGTLVDSSKGIIDSVNYALTKMNREIPSAEKLVSFIGPPLSASFEKELQTKDNVEIEQAITFYREYYVETGIFENTVYEGIRETLEELNAKGAELYIATSKPEIFARKIVDHVGLTPYFSGIYGATLDNTRSKKADVISYALKESKITDIPTTVMIGDREHDILGAKANSMDSIGILYGFGDYEELAQAGADEILRTPLDLLTILKK